MTDYSTRKYGQGRYDGTVHHRDRELSYDESVQWGGVAVACGIGGAMLLDVITRVLGVG